MNIAVDNDLDNDGDPDGTADSSVGLAPAFLLTLGLAPTLLLTPLLGTSFVVALYELLKTSADYYPILERPG
jgi:hypothetical protein